METIYSNYGAVMIDKVTDTCPICNYAISPKQIDAHQYKPEGSEHIRLDYILQCTKKDCQRIFISEYVSGQDPQTKNYILKLKGSFPQIPAAEPLPEEIKRASPDFERIYQQAHKAELLGLEDIAGVGYRKSLEFLIKDYCVAKNPGEEKKIKELGMGKVISEFVTDQNIKECARRASWLGNDETHYERIWLDKDIEDLKILIKLACHWISNEILTERYLADMRKKTNQDR